MRLHRTRESVTEPLQTEQPLYLARHLLDVPVDTESRTPAAGGSHASRGGFGLLGGMGPDIATA